jgi:hypothetical protein
MNVKQSSLNLASLTRPVRGAARFLGLLLCAAITLVLGLIPFLVGFLIQLLIRRPVSDAILLPLGAATVLVPWYLFGWLSLVIGEAPPLWPSVVLSTILAAGFSVTGGYVCRFVFRRRFTPTPNERNA